MKKILFLSCFFIIYACGFTQSAPVADGGHSDGSEVSLHKVGNYVLRITLFDMEFTSKCPTLEILSANKKKVIDTLELCQIKVPEFREFNAKKDFSFIEFTNFQVTNRKVEYEIDFALLQGNAFIVKCKVNIQNKKFVQEACLMNGNW